jgi:hypothetical protein
MEPDIELELRRSFSKEDRALSIQNGLLEGSHILPSNFERLSQSPKRQSNPEYPREEPFVVLSNINKAGFNLETT